MNHVDSALTYADLERKFEAVINSSPQLLPRGTVAKVKICHGDGRKVRGNALAAKHFTDENIVEVSFETLVPTPAAAGTRPEQLSPLASLMLKSLADLEVAAERDYIVLTWFRDKHLTSDQQTSKFPSSEVHTTLTDLINDGLILVDKVPHPKDPKIPVSTLRLNRSHREVQRLVGLPMAPSRPMGRRLHRISGPPLSQTILEGRR